MKCVQIMQGFEEKGFRGFIRITPVNETFHHMGLVTIVLRFGVCRLGKDTQMMEKRSRSSIGVW